MTDQDAVEFSQRIVALGELFDVKFSTPRISLYFEALRDLPFEEVVRAMNVAVRTNKFLPKPSELREIILGDADQGIEAAWVLFRRAMEQHGAYASVITMDPALGETIRALFTSWSAACAIELSPEMWTAKRKEWGRVYSLMLRRAGTQPVYLAGVIERANAGTADWQKFTPVVVIDRESVRALTEAEAAAYQPAALPPPVLELDVPVPVDASVL